MGFAPCQVDTMSLWQLNACWAAFIESKGGETQTGLAESEFEEISSWLDSF